MHVHIWAVILFGRAIIQAAVAAAAASSCPPAFFAAKSRDAAVRGRGRAFLPPFARSERKKEVTRYRIGEPWNVRRCMATPFSIEGEIQILYVVMDSPLSSKSVLLQQAKRQNHEAYRVLKDILARLAAFLGAPRRAVKTC